VKGQQMVCCRGEGERSPVCALAGWRRDSLTSETARAGPVRRVLCGSGERQWQHYSCGARLVLIESESGATDIRVN
jgi:hypothetical protein